MPKQALIFGATGAVGGELLELCLDEPRYSQVAVVARRPARLHHPKLRWIESAFDALDDLPPVPGLADGDAFCCLGTTIKAAGSEAAFRRVDYDFVVNSARYARECGVTHFSLVTAVGANPGSGIFYNRTKGEVEDAIVAEGFPSLHIFRPSLLTGTRAEFRLKEEVGKWAMFAMTPIFQGRYRRYKPVEISRLARAMIVTANQDRMTGAHRVYESEEIQAY